MDTTDEFPPGFEHIAEILRQAEEQLRLLDEQIENPPVDKGPQLGYSPPGSTTHQPPTSREQKVAELKKQRELVRSATVQNVEMALSRVNPETAKVVRSASVERIYPNQYVKMNAMDKKAHEKEEKDIFTSQDFVEGQIAEGKEKEARRNADKAKEEKGDRREFGTITKRVMESFRYSKVFKEADSEKLQEKGGPVKDKEVIGETSTRFTQSFSYLNAQEETEKMTDNSPEKENDVDGPEM